MTLLQRSILVLLLACLGCSAQPAPSSSSQTPDIKQKIEREIREYYNIPDEVNLTLSPFHPGEFAGYQAVTVTMDGQGKKQTFEFMISPDQKTLLRVTKLDLTKDPYVEVMKKFDLSGRPVRGNKDAKVVVVNFDDFQCPFCSRMHQVLFPELLKEYGDRVQFVYKDFPLSELHPWATRAAIDANCLAAQNTDAYWEFADYIHANQFEVNVSKNKDAEFATVDRITTETGKKHDVDSVKLQACIKAQDDSAVKASIREGDSAGVTATPTLFVNGKEVDGALPLSEMRTTLDQALARAGVPPPKHPDGAPSGGAAK